MFDIIVTVISVLYVLVCLFMILVILLQAGRGGMGTALGGGASQSVFGGGGSSDVLAKATQYCAVSFMVFAMFLAYAGAHSSSSRLQEKSEENKAEELDEAGEINWEAIGPNPVNLEKYAAAEMSESPESAEGLAAPGEPEGDAPSPAEAAPTPEGDPAAAPPADEAAPADAEAKGAP